MSEWHADCLERVRSHCRDEIERIKTYQDLAARDGKIAGGSDVRLALERVIRIADGGRL